MPFHVEATELTSLRVVRRCNLQAFSAQIRRTWDVLSQVQLSHNLLNLATLGRPDIDLAGQIGLTSVGDRRPL